MNHIMVNEGFGLIVIESMHKPRRPPKRNTLIKFCIEELYGTRYVEVEVSKEYMSATSSEIRQRMQPHRSISKELLFGIDQRESPIHNMLKLNLKQ